MGFFLELVGVLRRALGQREIEPMPTWRTVATQCGVQDIELHARGVRLELRGRYATSRVTVRTALILLSADDRLGTEIHVETPVAPGDEVTVRLEAALTAKQRSGGRPEIDLAAPHFNDVFLVAGEPARVRALLDAATRERLLALAKEVTIEADGGHFRLVYTNDFRWRRALPDWLDTAIVLGRHLAGELDLARALSDNAAADPVPEVRCANLLTLARERPDDPVTAAAIARAGGDRDPLVRLTAAKLLGEAGHAQLRALTTDRDLACAGEAVRALGSALPLDERLDRLDEARRARHKPVALALVEGLARDRDLRAVAALLEVLGAERDESLAAEHPASLAVASARALGASVAARDAPAVEPALVAALDHELSDLRLAAIEALGKLATVAAVEPLRRAAARARRDDVERAALLAVADIQRRATGAAPGQLTLSVAGGQLAIAAEAGRLSLGAEAGRLSEVGSRDADRVPRSRRPTR